MLGLKPLSTRMRAGWYFSSLVYGICVVGVASTTLDAYAAIWEHTPIVPLTVFTAAWAAGVLLIRLYLDGKDKLDLRDVLRLK